ncbi:MAG: hypothetical protein U1E59_10705 [Amaricoccus sp.]
MLQILRAAARGRARVNDLSGLLGAAMVFGDDGSVVRGTRPLRRSSPGWRPARGDAARRRADRMEFARRIAEVAAGSEGVLQLRLTSSSAPVSCT